MEFEKFKSQISGYVDAGKKIFATSSFQSHSMPLLHLISRLEDEVPVVFIDTGYHFPETIEFRDQVAQQFNLQIINVRSSVPRIHQRTSGGYLYFTSDTDRCCYLNKIQPMEPILSRYDIWINGVRADQNQSRGTMKVEQPAPFGCTRFHPMLNWTQGMIEKYCLDHSLPKHPLEAKGYFSVGCEPCTVLATDKNNRDGRWQGQEKTECGLHTILAQSKKAADE